MIELHAYPTQSHTLEIRRGRFGEPAWNARGVMDALGLQPQKVEVEIRRYDDGPDCDVVVTTRRRRLVMSCPTYDEALRWALLECRVYKLPAIIGQPPVGPRQPPQSLPGTFRLVAELQKVG